MKSQWRRSLLVCIFIYLSLLCILRDHLLPENIFGTQKNHTISPEQNFTCIWSIVENREICKPVCNHGFFGLYGMAKCHPLLTCGDIEQLKFSEEIGHMGYVKEVWHSYWQKYPVVVKKLRKFDWAGKIAGPGYLQGINLMKNFYRPSVLLQLVGHCNDTIVTEVHRLLDARDLEIRFKEYPLYNTLQTRMQLCVSYVDILRTLHSGHDGKIYVQCDARNLQKLAGQFLFTEDFRLVLSDVDSMETILVNGTNKRLIKCTVWGKVTGRFPAPEELWPYKERYDASKLPLYDEKIKIWKIPDVCWYFLGDDVSTLQLKLSLKDIHKQCKNRNPRKRPTAEQVYKTYLTIYKDMIKSNFSGFKETV
ncbi:protein O-mannose kinase-like [Crassostrea angulata]|uniref:protein O-mannose kinase-like n=1 Tax=Magallana angulata TaxID=2784310 RepID=UPI0022B1243F|nr:protein O-mannose kinase-like [Crassostrea angulata]